MKLIYADTNKYDEEYRIILTTLGTRRDLEKYGIDLKSDMRLTFYMDDADDNGIEDNLIFDGIVQFDEINDRWVAKINWDEIKNISKLTDGERRRLGIDH